MQRNPLLRLVRQVQTRLRLLARQAADRRALATPPITPQEQVKTILLILSYGSAVTIGILFQAGWRFPQAFCVSPTVSPPIQAVTATSNPAPLEFRPTLHPPTNQP